MANASFLIGHFKTHFKTQTGYVSKVIEVLEKDYSEILYNASFRLVFSYFRRRLGQVKLNDN